MIYSVFIDDFGNEMAMKKIPHPRLKPQMGDSQYRLLLQFRQPRDAGQQAQDARQGGGITVSRDTPAGAATPL